MCSLRKQTKLLLRRVRHKKSQILQNACNTICARYKKPLRVTAKPRPRHHRVQCGRECIAYPVTETNYCHARDGTSVGPVHGLVGLVHPLLAAALFHPLRRHHRPRGNGRGGTTGLTKRPCFRHKRGEWIWDKMACSGNRKISRRPRWHVRELRKK